MGENWGKWGGGIIIRSREKLSEHPVPRAEKWRNPGGRGGGGVMGEKWEKKCDEIPLFPNSISPIFVEAAGLPISSLYKN